MTIVSPKLGRRFEVECRSRDIRRRSTGERPRLAFADPAAIVNRKKTKRSFLTEIVVQTLTICLFITSVVQWPSL